MRQSLLQIMILGLLVGCIPKPVVTYTAYGVVDFQKQAEVRSNFEEAWKENQEASSVTVLNSTLPEGIIMDGDAWGVADGYNHQILGSFDLKYKVQKPKGEELIAHLQELGAAAGGDVVVASFKPHGDYENYFSGAVGIIIKQSVSIVPSTHESVPL